MYAGMLPNVQELIQVLRVSYMSTCGLTSGIQSHWKLDDIPLSNKLTQARALSHSGQHFGRLLQTQWKMLTKKMRGKSLETQIFFIFVSTNPDVEMTEIKFYIYQCCIGTLYE